ncbi:hypothetical protein [Variovorax paradoxus]|uniref:hypothetical protein n=1 Tax=Variovorax paradoxus TaxID=34073 RepID=UPI003D64D119
MTTLSANRHPLSERLFSLGAGVDAGKVRKLAYEAIRNLGSSDSYSPTRHELFALHLSSFRGEVPESFDDDTLAAATAFWAVFPKHLAVPELSLDDDGEVMFDWSPSVGRMLTVTLRHDGRMTYAARLGGGRTRHGTEYFNDAFPAWLGDLLSELGS